MVTSAGDDAQLLKANVKEEIHPEPSTTIITILQFYVVSVVPEMASLTRNLAVSALRRSVYFTTTRYATTKGKVIYKLIE